MKYLIPLLLVSTVAVAQESPPPRCAPADKIIQYLLKDYGEKPFATFTTNGGTKLLMLVSPTTSSFTVLAIEDDGKFCGVSAGVDFKPALQKDYEKYNEEKPKTPM